MPPIEASPSLSASIAVQNVGAMEFSPMAMSGSGTVKTAVAAMQFPEMVMQGHGLVGQIGHGEMKMPLFIMTGRSGLSRLCSSPRWRWPVTAWLGRLGREIFCSLMR